MILGDTKIFFDRIIQSDRLSFSSGTLQASQMDLKNYEKDSYIPREPWIQVKHEEIQMFSLEELGSLWEHGSSIGICKIPEEIIFPIQNIIDRFEIRQYQNIDNYQKVHNLTDFKDALQNLFHHVITNFSVKKGAKNLGICIAPPNLVTLTKDTNKPSLPYIGMHLDSWDKLPLNSRHKSRNRICINLGTNERYFLFINKTLKNIYSCLDWPYDNYDACGSELGIEFMKNYPYYPVTRLKILPGEAYIAPTDNLIHDASSASNQNLDVTLTFLGYFAPIAVAREIRT